MSSSSFYNPFTIKMGSPEYLKRMMEKEGSAENLRTGLAADREKQHIVNDKTPTPVTYNCRVQR